ncbi:MAPEG family protein [Shewanella sp. D64]|uniref:MAPEG family protein n=1 Tax=unclassified Shewanella TaxID=196818 RepID=UPI0022BA52C8|nr:MULTISPECIES: MAPEG family protein [unclassified Shewanella]MEC4724953.1 MAPEG family protein [Shewanella sp. D64]MEC4736854.1 MAPEG family protein [Shewanella sp. E94]WBJ96452.1 MAPEG family protein [Shewanella sp. MTB7]
MTTLLICLFIAMLLPYLAKGPVAVAMAKAGGYDNAHPREQQAKLTGFGARAVAGHQNAFESLILFGLAVVTVIATDSVNDTAVTFAIVHVIARIAYQVLYLIDKGTLRSLSWFVAIISSFVIFCQAF